jgi:methyl-accepting chemotaxis protein
MKIGAEKMSIKKKLITIMLLISFIPLVLLSTTMIRYLSKSLEEEKITQFKEIASEVKLQIDGVLDRPITAIKIVASNPAVGAFDLPQTKSFLVQARKTYPDISIVLDDLQGNMVARGDDAALVNIKDRAYFQGVLNGSDVAISEPVLSKTNGQLTLNIATPVREAKTGSILGVVQGAITISKVNEFVSQFSTNGTMAYVVDNTGKILAHPDEKLVKERTDFSTTDFVKEGLTQKKDGYSIVNDKTVGKKLVSYKYDERTGWLICLEVPYSIIMSKVSALSVILIVATLVVLGIVGALVLFMAKRVTAPIYRMQVAASKISQGDLTQIIDISSKDEIGTLAKSFNTMVTNLKSLIGQTQENAQQVAAASEQLTASAEQSAQAANQVAVSITQVAHGAEKQLHVVNGASVAADQMATSIQRVAHNANIVSMQSAKASETAVQGGKSVESAVRQMKELELTVSTSSQVVTQLGERSKEIGQIVGTISGLASQTNLLALNAAIEAARAGEQGRGFAVVAGEVRKLAEQSQEAAEQISLLVREIQGETDKAVSAMDAGTQGVKVGTEVVNEAGSAFQEIIGLVSELSDQVGEISTSIQQLSDGGQQIVNSVNEIDSLTRNATDEAQNVSAATEEQSASMEEIASSSQYLAKMAQSLQDAVIKFRI